MRVSHTLLPTVKEDPAGAEAISHKLMIRAGLIRQLGAGIYVFLPAGWRVMQKIAGIIREEMNAIGCQEILMPVINPAEVWQQSGRWFDIGDELFRLKDRKGADMVLAMTHEEVITWLAAREIHSYKQLPQLWYHIQTKERDEARPKSGILRTREFIMKDSYSLDVDVAGLQASYAKHIQAYNAIFRRCGLRTMMVQSDPGMMGGSISHEYMAFSEAGEDEVVFCSDCGYAANAELAAGRHEPLDDASAIGAPDAPVPMTLPDANLPAVERLREIHTPETRTIEEVTAFLGIPARRFIKSLVVVSETRGTLLVLVRGDHEVHEAKLRRVIGEFRLATANEIQEALGVQAGFVGPLRLRRGPVDDVVAAESVDLSVLADRALEHGVYVGGANRDHHHLAGITLADIPAAEFHDVRVVRGGEGCPQCAGILQNEPVIEVGNIFQLGTKYSAPMGATYLDERGEEHTIVMGSYGIGLARIAAAAVEQHNDADGIVWPATIAPFHVHVVVIKPGDPTQAQLGEQVYEQLNAVWLPGEERRPSVSLDVLLDDREVSPGVKFKDADLLGCPIQIVVGKRAAEGLVELKRRSDAQRLDVAAEEVARVAAEWLRELLGELL